MTDVGTLEFRALQRSDFVVLARWMAAPHVEVWWREDTAPAAVEHRYGPSVDGADPTECFIVVRAGEPVGFVQRYRMSDDPSWQASLSVAGSPDDGFGLDYLIGEETVIGQGVGPQIIDEFVTRSWTRYPEASAAVVSVNVDNRRSWRALEKAGFDRIWSGTVVSDDPSDEGESHVYIRRRPSPA